MRELTTIMDEPIDSNELVSNDGRPDVTTDDAYDDIDEYPFIPVIDATDDDFTTRWVDYVDRGPRDVVISGPIIGGWGPGRWHKNRRVAYWVAVDKYGEDRVKMTRQSSGRWSFLIKNLKQALQSGGAA